MNRPTRVERTIRCPDSYCSWRGRVPGTKALNPPPLVPSRGQLAAVDLLETTQDEANNLGLIISPTPRLCMHVLNQHRCRSSQEAATSGHGFQSLSHTCFWCYFDMTCWCIIKVIQLTVSRSMCLYNMLSFSIFILISSIVLLLIFFYCDLYVFCII